MTEGEYQSFVEHQRNLGRAQVGVLLDEMCAHFGWSPAVWRIPSLADHEGELAFYAFRRRWIMGLPPVGDISLDSKVWMLP